MANSHFNNYLMRSLLLLPLAVFFCSATTLLAQFPEFTLIARAGVNQPFPEEDVSGLSFALGGEAYLPSGLNHGLIVGLTAQRDNFLTITSSLVFINTSTGNVRSQSSGFELGLTSLAAHVGYEYQMGKFHLRAYTELSGVIGGSYDRRLLGSTTNRDNGRTTHSGRIGRITNEELTRHTISADESLMINLGAELVWMVTDRLGVGLNFSGTLFGPNLVFSETNCASANNCPDPLVIPFDGNMYIGRKSLRLGVHYRLGY